MLADTNRRILTDHRTGFDRRISDRRRGALRASPVPERRMGQLRTLEPRRRMVRRRGEQASFLARVRHRLYPTPLRPDPFDVLLAEATRQSVERVLDIGAGRGGIRPRFIPGSVLLVGCDATDAVLEHPTIDRGVQCDGERLPFADQSFDVCCMRYVIEHLRHPRRAFEEAYRVLRPAGRLVFVTPNAWYYASIAARVIPSRAHPRVVHWLTGRHESDVYPTFYAANTRARLRDQLHAVGFRERTLAFHQWGSGRGYLDFSVPTLLIDWAYEWAVNSTALLQAVRRMIVGDFERPPADSAQAGPTVASPHMRAEDRRGRLRDVPPSGDGPTVRQLQVSAHWRRSRVDTPLVAGLDSKPVVEGALVPAARTGTRLGAAVAVLAAFDRAGIRYCHWKSVWALERSLAGDTDLDLLVDRRQSREMQETLHRCGFKRFVATEAAGYPGVEDYLGIDVEAGRIIHCHVHYRLIFGQPNIKSYRLPWEERLLQSRHFDAGTKVYVPEPDLEMLVLLVRFAIKLRGRNVAGYVAGLNWLAELGREYEWLRRRIDPAASVRLCRELLGDEAAATFAKLLHRPLTMWQLIRFRLVVTKRLRLFRRHGLVARTFKRWHRQAVALQAALGRKRLHTTRPLRRVVPTGGVLIAFMGPDGSGKSTLARAAASLLAEKLDVLLIYFGSGQGPGALLRWPLKLARAAAARLAWLPVGQGLRPTGDKLDGTLPPGPGLLVDFALIVWALTLAWEKRRKLRTAWRARDAGIVVLADHYPQAQVLGCNDAPLLGHFAHHRSAVLRWIARLEAAPYLAAERYPPDLVVKLHVAPHTAVQRNPDTIVLEVERRLAALGKLVYPLPTEVVDVDAARPLGVVRRDLYQIVWDQI